MSNGSAPLVRLLGTMALPNGTVVIAEDSHREPVHWLMAGTDLKLGPFPDTRYHTQETWVSILGGSVVPMSEDVGKLPATLSEQLIVIRSSQWGRSVYAICAGAGTGQVTVAAHFASLTKLAALRSSQKLFQPMVLRDVITLFSQYDATVELAYASVVASDVLKDEISVAQVFSEGRSHVVRVKRRGLSFDMPFAGKGPVPDLTACTRWTEMLALCEAHGLVFAGAWEALPHMPLPAIGDPKGWTIGPVSGSSVDGVLHVRAPLMSQDRSFNARWIGRDPDGFRLALTAVSQRGIPRLLGFELQNLMNEFGMRLRVDSVPDVKLKTKLDITSFKDATQKMTSAMSGAAIAAADWNAATSKIGALLASGGMNAGSAGSQVPIKHAPIMMPQSAMVKRKVAHLSAEEEEALEAFRKMKRATARAGTVAPLADAGARMIDLGDDDE